jgi:hypothetical protein
MIDYLIAFFMGFISAALPGIILMIIKSIEIKSVDQSKVELIKKILWGDENGK